jgi:hypothetical protein
VNDDASMVGVNRIAQMEKDPRVCFFMFACRQNIKHMGGVIDRGDCEAFVVNICHK